MIFIVALGHCCDFYTGDSEKMRSLFVFIYSFHMPLFLFVSGLFGKRTVDERRYDRIIGYLVLYLFAKFIYLLYFGFFRGILRFPLLTEDGLPWFMFALFAFSLLTIALRRYSPKYVFIVWLFLACATGYDAEIGDYLVLSRLIVYYPFYYLGYCLDRKKLEAFCDRKGVKAAAAIILLTIATLFVLLGDKLYFLRPLTTGRNPYSNLGTLKPYGFFLRLLVYAIGTAIGGSLVVLTPNRLGKGLIARWGQRTLVVYCFHNAILKLLYQCYDFKELLSTVLPNHSNIIIVPFCLLLTILLSRKRLNDLLSRLAVVPMRKPSA